MACGSIDPCPVSLNIWRPIQVSIPPFQSILSVDQPRFMPASRMIRLTLSTQPRSGFGRSMAEPGRRVAANHPDRQDRDEEAGCDAPKNLPHDPVTFYSVLRKLRQSISAVVCQQSIIVTPPQRPAENSTFNSRFCRDTLLPEGTVRHGSRIFRSA